MPCGVKPALHFVGFRGEEWWSALRIWGRPDFIHRHWDLRAAYGGELHPSDTVVFAHGDEHQPVRPFSFDDSSVF